MFFLNNVPTPLQPGDQIEFDLDAGSFQIRRGGGYLNLGQTCNPQKTCHWRTLKLQGADDLTHHNAMQLGELLASAAGYDAHRLHESRHNPILEIVELLT